MKRLTSSLAVLTLTFLPLCAQAQNALSGSSSGSSSSSRSGNSGATVNYSTSETYSTPANQTLAETSNDTLRNNTQAPDIVTSGANVCALPMGASTSILGFGFGLSANPTDKGCERRNNAAALFALGYRPAATELMCQDKDVSAAMTAAGTPCNAVTVPTPIAVAAPARPYQNPLCAGLNPNSAEDQPYWVNYHCY